MADVTPPEERARGMGLIGAAFGLGFVLGPAIGGLLSQYALAVPGLAAAALAVANGVAAWFLLPEPAHRATAPTVRRGRLAALVDELARPGMRRLLASGSWRAGLQRHGGHLLLPPGRPVRPRPATT